MYPGIYVCFFVLFCWENGKVKCRGGQKGDILVDTKRNVGFDLFFERKKKKVLEYV